MSTAGSESMSESGEMNKTVYKQKVEGLGVPKFEFVEYESKKYNISNIK
jgi:hypothetical protein